MATKFRYRICGGDSLSSSEGEGHAEDAARFEIMNGGDSFSNDCLDPTGVGAEGYLANATAEQLSLSPLAGRGTKGEGLVNCNALGFGQLGDTASSPQPLSSRGGEGVPSRIVLVTKLTQRDVATRFEMFLSSE